MHEQLFEALKCKYHKWIQEEHKNSKYPQTSSEFTIFFPSSIPQPKLNITQSPEVSTMMQAERETGPSSSGSRPEKGTPKAQTKQSKSLGYFFTFLSLHTLKSQSTASMMGAIVTAREFGDEKPPGAKILREGKGRESINLSFFFLSLLPSSLSVSLRK